MQTTMLEATTKMATLTTATMQTTMLEEPTTMIALTTTTSSAH